MPPPPRGLIILASVWLFASWVGAMGFQPPLQASVAGYLPGLRTMLFSTTVGALVAWPLLRLSQAPEPAPIRATLLDLAVVLGMTNLVLWPLRLVTAWPAARMGCVLFHMGAWILTTGALLAWSRSLQRPASRTLAMAACVLLALGWLTLRGIAPGAVPARFPAPMGGPIEGMLALVDGGGAPPTREEWGAVACAAALAGGAWLLVGLHALVARTRGQPAGHLPHPA